MMEIDSKEKVAAGSRWCILAMHACGYHVQGVRPKANKIKQTI